MQNVAIYTICNDSFVPGVKVLLHSFLKHNTWFTGDIVILYSTALTLSLNYRDELSSMFPNVKCKCVDLSKYKKLLLHWDGHVIERFKPSILTLEIFASSAYDRIIYLDADMLILDDIHELVELPDGYVYACVHERLVVKEIIPFMYNHPTSSINAGFFVVTKKFMDDRVKRRLVRLGERFSFRPRFYHHCFEQDIINLYFSRGHSCKILPNKYNMIKRVFKENQLELTDEKIIHYIGDKPWNSELPEYSYIDSIWYQYNKELENTKIAED